MKIIAVHNTRGGVGSTFHAAHLCHVARALGIPVAALEMDRRGDLKRCLGKAEIPVLIPDDLDHLDDKYELLVMDIKVGRDAPATPDAWLIPIDRDQSLESACVLTDQLPQQVIWISSKGHAAGPVPPYLRRCVQLVSPVPWSRALEQAGIREVISFADDDLAQVPGVRALWDALHEVLRHVWDVEALSVDITGEGGTFPVGPGQSVVLRHAVRPHMSLFRARVESVLTEGATNFADYKIQVHLDDLGSPLNLEWNASQPEIVIPPRHGSPVSAKQVVVMIENRGTTSALESARVTFECTPRDEEVERWAKDWAERLEAGIVRARAGGQAG